ncbi:uncharacterized protein LOC128860020 isoform X1 [Anastrepha ludens]|uniref:uncharacterized protein LOC128860020 isoform X1 n=1 Tax=Anastrepha ludens TaxID=28586 RepID=UPI0023B19E1F|nr:uncharacterized protein LOC128860020 isoform X1 [Anastrepha ludens]
MSNQCKDLDKLSTDRKWDDVFHCLKIDVNSTIELGNLKVSQIGEQSDKWLDDYKATMNSLEVILAIILLFDQIFYILLVWYLICFAIKFIRYRGLRTLCQLTKRFYSLEKKIKNQNKSKPLTTRKKTITFAKGAFDNSKY